MTTDLERPTCTMVQGRVVLVYTPPGTRWRAGVLIGYAQADGVVLEHVIAYRRGVLLGLLRAGIEMARHHGYRHIIFCIPSEFPGSRPLGWAAKKVGAIPYTIREEAEGLTTWWVLWL